MGTYMLFGVVLAGLLLFCCMCSVSNRACFNRRYRKMCDEKESVLSS